MRRAGHAPRHRAGPRKGRGARRPPLPEGLRQRLRARLRRAREDESSRESLGAASFRGLAAIPSRPSMVQNQQMLLKDKRALIFGVVNERSLAYGIAEQFHRQGARLGFGYASAPVRKRLEPIAERLNGELLIQCDVTSDEQIQAGVEAVAEKW